ncbi:MAG: SxtJ family membrane protein [Planctomycetota bacterium]|nr:SxtJ family membrane protein [Planctomycetota bacterium]
MALVDINWNPSRKELRVFSLLLIGFGAIVAAILYKRLESQTPAAAALFVTSVVGLVGLAAPMLVRPVYVIWMGLAFPIGWTVSHVMMLAAFYFVLTPIGLVMRLCGRDPMRRQIDRGAKTHWLPRSNRGDLKSYFRQF